jgi:hypothetical protein
MVGNGIDGDEGGMKTDPYSLLSASKRLAKDASKEYGSVFIPPSER